MKVTSKYTEGFGERMRDLRRKDKLKQDELAKKLNVTRQSISGYETERIFPSIKVVEKMCGLYNVSPWWLLYGIGYPITENRDIAPKGGIEYQPEGEQGLTPTQMALIEFIKEDKDAAQQLAKQLWEKALKI